MPAVEFRINERIRAREVRVVDADGGQLGVLSLDVAKRLAMEKNLDLVEVAPKADPPVCRLLDYGRFKFEQAKRSKPVKPQKLKEIQFRPVVGEHDFAFKLKNVIEFLEKGEKVRVVVKYKAREMSHAEIGKKIMDKIMASVTELAIVDKPPVFEGRNLSTLLVPSKKHSNGHHPHEEVASSPGEIVLS